MTENEQLRSTFESLRQFARPPQRLVERCELCSLEVCSDHPHLIELARRRLVCTCDACAMLFSGQANPKYKRVSRRVQLLAGFELSDADWDGLMIPINLAFFLENSLDARVSAFYPSPAGAIESSLPIEAWTAISCSNPALHQMEADVEALLVNRVGHAHGGAPSEHYIVPIDACYRLVGLIRLHWRGFAGGTEVWQEIARFFSDLRGVAITESEQIHA